MGTGDQLLLLAFAVALVVLSVPVGHWLARLASDAPLPRVMAALESGLAAVCGRSSFGEMAWSQYAIAVLVFNCAGALVLYALQRMQGFLPLNPAQLAAPSVDLAFNTALSFITNTDWQSYGGETVMSRMTQMLGLAVQNFLSAATGIAVAFALIRGFARRTTATIGNFWRDLSRITLYLLMPLAFVFAIFLMGQGVVQNFGPDLTATTLEVTHYDNPRLDASGAPLKDDKGNALTDPATTSEQVLPMGPVASQEAIKMVGTNGGGYYNANSAHPYENPTPLSNFMQMLSIFLIPAALCITFGKMVGDMRQGIAIYISMALLFVAMAALAIWAETHANPLLGGLGIDLSGGNMEGKETRFGVVASALFAAITTAASCGAVNSMHDSFMPLGGLAPMWLIQFGEVVFGGVGSGLYGMLMYAVVAVFVAGLMIGRTPEYIGKKIESFDMKMTSLAILVTPFFVLILTAIAVVTDAGQAGIANPGAHGFSEILYAFSSAANNNGSAFAGLSTNTPFYNIMLAIAVCFGRFGVIVPVLAVAGSLARKKRIEPGAGTLPTHATLFIAMLLSTVLLVGALTYIPALALGPIVEQLQLLHAH